MSDHFKSSTRTTSKILKELSIPCNEPNANGTEFNADCVVGTKSFVCHICMRICPSQCKFREITYSNITSNVCDECYEMYKLGAKQKSVHKHHFDHGKENIFNQKKAAQRLSHSCNVCFKVFQKEISLKSHMRKHKAKTFTCTYCEKKFIYKNSLSKHYSNIHLNMNIVEQTENNVINSHLKTEVEPKNQFALPHSQTEIIEVEPESCIICNQSFDTTYELGLHLITHALD